MIQISQYIINQIYCFIYVTILYLLYYNRLMKIILEKKIKLTFWENRKQMCQGNFFGFFLFVLFSFLYLLLCLDVWNLKVFPPLK